jgi:anti-anti-sigma regulatory factor
VHKHAEADGGELLLVAAKAAVLRVFTITGVDRLIPNFTSLEDALAHASTQSDGRRAGRIQ